MITVDKGVFDKLLADLKLKPSSSNGDGSSNSKLTRRFPLYDEKIDTSRVPRIFRKFKKYGHGSDVEEGEEDGIYMFPEDDSELLSMFGKSLDWPRSEDLWDIDFPQIYYVEVKADSCTVENCLELLKKIACETRFITCSVDNARLFYAELKKDEAAKLRGLDEICDVYRRGDYLEWVKY